jgi:peptidoglycan/xylan/chitin deacetylase (PgdA/CDA1 family)
LRVRWRADTTARRVALTFDDGPDPAWTPRVLELLGRYSARATFFNVGHNARRHPALTAACAQNGEVGNHSLNHPDLTTLSRDAILRQLRDTHQILTDIVGTPPRLFRPPYGNISGPVLEIAARLGYETILWTDRVQSGGPTVRADVDAVMSRMSPGAIVMGHDGRRNRQGVLDRLPGLLERLTSEGYTCVTVSDLEPAV